MLIRDVKERVDRVTGEIIESMCDIRKITKTTQRPFIIVYTDTLEEILLWAKAEQAVMFWCWKNCEYNSNLIRITEQDKEDISDILSVKKRSINNAISNLNKCRLLIRQGKGNYTVNPLYFWKGRTKDNLLEEKQKEELKAIIADIEE